MTNQTGKTMWVVLMLLLGLVIIGLGIFVYDCTHRELFKAGPIKSVKPESWAKLKIGMSKEEVVALLGDSHSKHGPGKISAEVSQNNTRRDIPLIVTTSEFWEYNWSEGLSIFGPSDKAHVVYFDANGKVYSFREPLK